MVQEKDSGYTSGAKGQRDPLSFELILKYLRTDQETTIVSIVQNLWHIDPK